MLEWVIDKVHKMIKGFVMTKPFILI